MPEILDFLLGEGFRVSMEEAYADELGREYPIVSFSSIGTALDAADFALVVGGDGTILHIAPEAARLGKPVLGINFGTMGFLSELDLSTLELLKKVEHDQYEADERLMLDVRVIDAVGKEVFRAAGLNDAAVMKGDISKTAKLAVNVDGKRVMSFSGDGVVVCTPTGSTAYSLSAGGPIIEPSSSCMAVTPICPHSLVIKSFVVSSDREIEVTIPPQEHSIKLSVDGFQNRDMTLGDRIIIRRGEKALSLLRLKGIGFYDRINQKLSNERL